MTSCGIFFFRVDDERRTPIPRHAAGPAPCRPRHFAIRAPISFLSGVIHPRKKNVCFFMKGNLHAVEKDCVCDEMPSHVAQWIGRSPGDSGTALLKGDDGRSPIALGSRPKFLRRLSPSSPLGLTHRIEVTTKTTPYANPPSAAKRQRVADFKTQSI